MSLINLFVAARNAWSGWRKRQRAYGELMMLDDRSLADIGIRRSDIPAVVEGFTRRPARGGQRARPSRVAECPSDEARLRALAAADLDRLT
jgi:uncharacterized protein YjiS (DUF1127 family)